MRASRQDRDRSPYFLMFAQNPCSEMRHYLEMHRIFSNCSRWFIAGALLVAAGYAPAQTSNPLSAEVKWMYGTIKNNLVKLAEKMPAENYSFRPTPEVGNVRSARRPHSRCQHEHLHGTQRGT